jgi:drug/metabolite transporter (DMT)-like permease
MKTTKRAIILILLASLCAGTGQLFFRKATLSIHNIISLINPFMFIGIFFYLIGIVLMTLAFKEGELSVLHPFLAISYVWVTIASHFIFMSETLGINKIIAVIIIFFGVYMIGLGGKIAHDN